MVHVAKTLLVQVRGWDGVDPDWNGNEATLHWAGRSDLQQDVVSQARLSRGESMACETTSCCQCIRDHGLFNVHCELCKALEPKLLLSSLFHNNLQFTSGSCVAQLHHR